MFKVGQKVVCINNNFTRKDMYPLTIGEIYTISVITGFYQGFFYIKLEGIPPIENYATEHFRPLDETFAESVLENIKEQIKEEELVCV